MGILFQPLDPLKRGSERQKTLYQKSREITLTKFKQKINTLDMSPCKKCFLQTKLA